MAAMTPGWEAGTEPWARRAVMSGEELQCPFCGQHTLIRSFGDLRADNARVELYCDSQDCDAREITVLVMRDATAETAGRPDVRALEAIETGKYGPERRGQIKAYSFGHILKDQTTKAGAVLERRTTGGPVIDLRTIDEDDDPDEG